MVETAHGPSIEILKRGRDKDRLELEELTAKVAAFEASRGRGDPLLIQVARALLLADLTAEPLQAAQINGDRVMRTNPHHVDPGAATRIARNHARVLRKNLSDAVARFDHAVEYWNENGSYPPRVKEEWVRCKTRKCKGENVKLPLRYAEATDHRCLVCGNRLYPT